MDNFNYIWRWKISTETVTTHILDAQHRMETYRRLCSILPKWQTYRNGDNSQPLQTLRDALWSIGREYDQIRKYTLLEFDAIPRDTLEPLWHELGRVKEYRGNRNDVGAYYIIAVTKPLLLIWGQTLAFDSHVRRNCPLEYGVPRYSTRWRFDGWMSVMNAISHHLNQDARCVAAIENESEKRYGRQFPIPYGRFLDIFYW